MPGYVSTIQTKNDMHRVFKGRVELHDAFRGKHWYQVHASGMNSEERKSPYHREDGPSHEQTKLICLSDPEG